MTVSELIDILAKYPSDMNVMLNCDDRYAPYFNPRFSVDEDTVLQDVSYHSYGPMFKQPQYKTLSILEENSNHIKALVIRQ